MYRFIYISRGMEPNNKTVSFARENSVELKVLMIPRADDENKVRQMLTEMLGTLDIKSYDAIICRGGMEDTLKKLNLPVHIPIVGIKFLGATTFNMMAHVFENHPEEFEKPLVRVWVLSHQPVYIDEYSMMTMFHSEVSNIHIDGTVSREILEEAKKSRVDFLLCGPESCRRAEALGIRAYFNPYVDETETLNTTIKQTMDLVDQMKQQSERSKMIEAIMDYSFEGLLQIDTGGKIIYFNAQMQNIIGRKPELITGKYLWDLIPELEKTDIKRVLEKNENIYGNIVEIHGKERAILNLIPNIRKGQVVGAILYLYRKEEISALDVKLNPKTYEKGLFARYHFEDIIGNSKVMDTCKYRARQFARHHANVLILGESGTGKELFAQSIHNFSTRRGQPFVAVNCGALPENLLESELFGYVGGAFTGANSKGKKGLIEQADKGTIFLDEIGEMSIEGQVRLLRVLEERVITRVGDDRQIPVDVRIIAATNRNLYEEVVKGKFREDLYYRLNVLTLSIPPLRDRAGDIELLAESFLEKYGAINHKNIKLTNDARELLASYRWHGNVRQLRNFCERLAIICDKKTVTREYIADQLNEIYRQENVVFNDKEGLLPSPSGTSVNLPIERNGEKDAGGENYVPYGEKADIVAALNRFGGNRNEAAQFLGIGRSTLWRKMKKYGISDMVR